MEDSSKTLRNDYLVEVNGVVVGSMSATSLDTVHRSTWTDLGLWCGQCVVVGRTVFNAFVFALRWWPTAACFVLTYLAKFDPEQLGTLSALPTAEMVLTILSLAGICSVMAACVAFLLGNTFDFEDLFQKRLEERVRLLVDCSSLGKIEWRSAHLSPGAGRFSPPPHRDPVVRQGTSNV